MAIVLLCVGCLVLAQPEHRLLRLGDERFVVTEGGAVGASELPRSRDAAKHAKTWRMRVRIATRLVVGDTHIALAPASVAKVRDAFTEFQRRVVAYSRGRVRIETDIEVRSEPMRVARTGEPFWLTPTKEQNCGISGDGVDSVFLVFPPGRMELAMLAGTFGGDRGPDGAGSTGLAWVERRAAEMPRVILHEWLHQVEWLARRRFGMPWLPGPHDGEGLGFPDEDRVLAALLGRYLSPAFWGAVGMRETQQVARQPLDRARGWDAVAGDLWRRSPLLDDAGLSACVGRTVRIAAERGIVRVNGEPWRLAERSAFVLPVRDDRYVVLVRGDRAGTFGRALRGGVFLGVMLPLRAHRRIDSWEAGGTATPLAVFEARCETAPRTDLDLLELQEDQLLPEEPDLVLEFRAKSGPLSVVRGDAPFVLRVRNSTKAKIAAKLEVWVPPDVVVLDLPESITVGAGATSVFPCRVRAEADRTAGFVDVRVIARTDAAKRGEARARLHVAVARDFLRLDFETRVLGMRQPDRIDSDGGDWKARRRRGGVGTGFLRIRDGGGSRFGRHYVMPRSSLSFDTEQFSHLTFYLRAKPREGARVAINVTVGKEVFSIPLVGAFVRKWDERRELPRADVRLDGAWHRVTYDLDAALDRVRGDRSHRVSSIDIGDTRAKCSNQFTESADEWEFAVDEFAVVRDPAETADDRLRYLTQRYHRSLSVTVREELAAKLSKVDPAKLGAQGRVDHSLLHHALAWQGLAAKLPSRRRGEPVGSETFAAMLRHRHHLEQTPAQLLDVGLEQVRIHQEQMATLAEKIRKGKSWREVVALLKERHPSAEELPKLAKTWMQKAIDFSIEKNLVTVPMAARHADIRVVTSGVLSRTYPFGGYGGARPSARGFTGTYFVSPPANWMNEQQAKDRLRGNHYAWTRVVALHEVVPGHHLQTVVHKMRPLSRFRQGFYSTVFAEGWAMLCEDLLFRNGFFPDNDTRFTQLQMRLWRAARIVIDASLQTGKMTMQQAEEYLVREVALDPVNAKAEVARYIDNPTRPMSYLMGYLLIDAMGTRMREKLGEKFSEREFLDRVLSFGPVPLPAVAKGLGL